MPIVADAAVKIGADFSTFGSELERGTKSPIQSLGARIKGALSPQNLAVGGAILGAAVVAGLASATRALIDIERLNAQTDAVIRSTGGAAGVTRDQIEEAAEAAERATTIEREAVQEAANMLLTFTNIRNEAGEGNDIFNQTTDAVLDMSVAMGTDARTSAMQLGKALNDPVKGMSQLARAGVQFTDEQKRMVEALVATGDLLGAQKVILAELETQFGGSAEAFADTTAGKIQRFQNDVGNMFESIILGAVNVADALGTHGENIGKGIEIIGDVLSTEVVTWEGIFGKGTDAVKAEMDEMEQATRMGASAAARNVYEEFEKGGPVIAEEAGKIAGMLPSEIQARVDEVRAAGANQIVEFAAGMLDKQNDPMLAMEALQRAQETALDRGAEIARLKGQLTSSELAAGLNDNRVEVRVAAQAARLEITQRLEALNAYGWGANVASTLAQGILDNIWRARAATIALSSATGAAIRIESEPPDSQSGLRGITKWGGNIVKTIADGMLGELGTGAAASRALAGALVPSLGVPALGGGTAGMAGGGGPTFILQVEGQPPFVGSRDDVLDRWQQMTSFTKEGVQ